MTEEVVTKIRLVCVGVERIVSKKGLFPAFTRVLVDGSLSTELGEQRCVWSKLKGTVGNVYEVESTEWTEERKLVSPSTMRYVLTWPNDVERAEWKAAASAERTADDARKLEENADRANALRELLAPLRRMYSTSMPAQKRALLACIINEVTNPWRDTERRAGKANDE